MVASGEATATEVTQAHLDRIAEVEVRVRAFITVQADEALATARRLGSRIVGPLHGVPIVLKDNICTSGTRTTCGSRMLRDFVPPYDATVVRRLRDAGAVVLGKANLDEFAMGSSTENSAFGPTRNPWNLDRVPGGSSGGSAAAVAACETPLALGSDTGGSIRQPASLCGVVGLKPTYGRVSRYGLVAYASSLDQIGPIARSVADAALLLTAIAGHDPMDSTSLDHPVPNYVAACGGDVRGMRIGLPRECFDGVAPAVSDAVRNAAQVLGDLGAAVEECSLPATTHSLAAYYILAPAEASSNLARYDGVKYGHRAGVGCRPDAGATNEPLGHAGLAERSRAEGFGTEVKQRIMIGTYALSAGYYDAYYRQAQQVRTLVRRDYAAALERFDVLLTPTSPTVAFRIGELCDDPLAMKLADICTIPVNLAGLPAISLPCGFDDGMPIGLQIIGAPLAEETILRVAHCYEQATEWRLRRPSAEAQPHA
ncbi:MAG: Asp-tRNA(Asn)/Glu-tRNA(Gln) amidotransferase subunit GatA [Armatimonadetes bacterium]|nr:Asp-tRNA(Asn)/Glu-tRNA(Gln) amidotransferase subunit GatA [Armatimonadota bacterium]